MREVLVCYDVSANRKRNRLARFLEKQGRRLQKSVFLVTVAHGRLEQFKRAILELVDAEDEILLIPLCASCQAGMQRSGVVQELALVA